MNIQIGLFLNVQSGLNIFLFLVHFCVLTIVNFIVLQQAFKIKWLVGLLVGWLGFF